MVSVVVLFSWRIVSRDVECCLRDVRSDVWRVDSELCLECFCVVL